MRGPRKQQDFQKFYFNYVGKGEACGCAERVIDVAEMERKASGAQSPRSLGLGRMFRRIFRSKSKI